MLKSKLSPLFVIAAIAVYLTGCATPPDPAQLRLLTQFPEERPFPESRFTSISSVRLHYRVWEPPQRALGKILLLPTVGGSTVTFRNLGPELADAGYAVLAVDPPAFGFSSQAMEFQHTFQARAELLWSLADRIDTDSNAFLPTQGWTVLGHGTGGQLGVKMAQVRPMRTERLVLISSMVAGELFPSRHLWFPPVRWGLRAWLVESIYTETGVAELLSDALGRAATEEEIALYAAPLLRDGMADAYIQYARTAGREEFALEEVETPTLLLWGDLDQNVDLAVVAQATDRLPNATAHIISGAAHVPMATHPDQTRRLIIEWLGADETEA